MENSKPLMENDIILEALEEAFGALQASNAVYKQLCSERAYLNSFIKINEEVMDKISRAVASLSSAR